MKDYKKILKGVVNIIDTTEKSDIGFANICAYIGKNCPELKESEGERIRKALMCFLEDLSKLGKNTNFDRWSKSDCAEWIAWLEKQGEKDKFIEKELQCIKGYREKAIKRLEEPEKQGEQKPINKPKFKVKYAGSEYNVFEIKDIAGVTLYGIEDEPNHIDYVKAENCERVGGYGIKESGLSFPTKPAIFSEQKPTWSEEDLDSITAAINNLEYLKNNYVYHQMGLEPAITFLKSLKDRYVLQPKQEWTMQDEEELQIALDTLVKAGQHSSAKWLKNVCLVPQSQWKPSDEQMEVLLSEVKGWTKGCPKQIVLESLYQDLKKLKEE